VDRACSSGHVHPIDPRAVSASDPDAGDTSHVTLARETRRRRAMKSRNDVRAIPSARATIVDGSTEVTSMVTVVLDLGEKSVLF